MFAIPTELPMQEMTNPHLLLNLSSVVICFDFIVLNSLSFSSSVQMCFYIRKIQQNNLGSAC